MKDQLALFEERKIYSLAEVAENIKEALQAAYPGFYWIKAEIAKLNYYHKSGHCYLDLVEKQDKITKAEMRATIWAANFQMLSAKFRQQTREELRDGMAILFMASISFHEVYGLSLNIIDIEPSFTLGEMAREKRDTIEKLKKEGVFDLNRRLLFPLLPKKIAVISVETSKGYGDLVATITHNPYGYALIFRLFPAILQGEKAVETIVGQLRRISKHPGWFDAVAIIRGGGGEVGLSAYDNLELAREVACFPLPVITGIGHSTNETVVEMVAHSNMITPTAVANFLLGYFKSFEDRITGLQDNLFSYVAEILYNTSSNLISLTQRFQASTNRLLERNQNALKSKQDRINIYSRQILFIQSKQMDTFGKKIELLDPINVLGRGYSITFLDGTPLTDAHNARKGQTIETRLFRGTLRSTIDSKDEIK